jgi:hypothetical protein
MRLKRSYIYRLCHIAIPNTTAEAKRKSTERLRAVDGDFGAKIVHCQQTTSTTHAVPPQDRSSNGRPLTLPSRRASATPAHPRPSITRIRACPSKIPRHRRIERIARLVNAAQKVKTVRHLADLSAVVQTPFTFAAGRDVEGCGRPWHYADSAGHAGGVKFLPGLGVASGFCRDW